MAISDIETDEANTLHRRRTYIKMRLPLIKEEIKSLNAERKEGHEKLKDRGGEHTPELKQLRARQLYRQSRVEALKAEQQALQSEQKILMEKHRPVLASTDDAVRDED